MSSVGELQNTPTCPQCGGEGKVTHRYQYKAQRRSDTTVETIERRNRCGLCNGSGHITPDIMDHWRQVQANPICPVCRGEGGKYFWTLDETDSGTRKQFAFQPCSLCQDEKHVSLVQLAEHERARRRLRFRGVGCTVLAVVGGLFIVTQAVSILLARTPWIQCCAPPHVAFVSGMIVLSRKMGWF